MKAELLQDPDCKSHGDQVNFGVYLTSDSVELGLKIRVSYRIPKKWVERAFAQFDNIEAIQNHIEGIVQADMTKIAKGYSSQTFNKSESNLFISAEKQTIQFKKDETPGDSKNIDVSNNTPMQNQSFSPFNPPDTEFKKDDTPLQDSKSENIPKLDELSSLPLPFAPCAPLAPKSDLQHAEGLLKKHLEEFGIELICMTILQVKFMDDKLSHEIQKNALITASTGAKLATLEQEATIAKAGAEQNRDVSIITQSRENEAEIKAAEAKLAKTKLELEAQKLTAEAEAKNIELLAKAKGEAIKIEGAARNAVLAEQARLYEQHRDLLTIELAKIKSDAFKDVSMNVTSSEFRTMLQTPGISFHGPRSASPRAKARPSSDHKEESRPPVTRTPGS